MGSEDQELADVYAQLLARAPESRIEPRLAATLRAVELLGDVHKASKVVHVAGTNGKTTTVRIIEQLVRSYGLRTGRFTSPHLSSVTERISIDGESIAPADFVRVWQEIGPVLAMVDSELAANGEPTLTFFESLTVLAFAAFADAPVDVVVLETGLGGTWDSTNVAEADVAVITPISLDHTDLLGETLGEIAGEKAGIISPNSTVVVSGQESEAAEVLASRIAELGVESAWENQDFGLVKRQPAVGGQVITVQGRTERYDDLFLPLFGEHQAHNAATAIAAAESLLTGGAVLNSEIVGQALSDVTSPGRLELVKDSPTILVDAAHNPAGAAALTAALKEAYSFGFTVGVVGILDTKDARGIIGNLAEAFDKIVLTESASERAIPAEDLLGLAEASFASDDVYIRQRLDDAIAAAVEIADESGQPHTGIVVTGSITVISEARILLGSE